MTRHLTVEGLAERWRTTSKAIYGQRHRGELPAAVRIGRKLLWPEAAIEAFELARMEGTAGVRKVPRSSGGPRSAAPRDYSAWFKQERLA